MFESLPSGSGYGVREHAQACGGSHPRQCGAVLPARRARRASAFTTFRPGELFYLHRPAYEVIPETAQAEITADRLNPYPGPSHKAGQPFDFPLELRESAPRRPPGDQQLRVQLSVQLPDRQGQSRVHRGHLRRVGGVFFCLAGVDRLVADLQQHDFFRDRTIVPLCMAHEGYKQPQQLIVLAYFLSIGQASIWSSTSMASTRWRSHRSTTSRARHLHAERVAPPSRDQPDRSKHADARQTPVACRDRPYKQRLAWLTGDSTAQSAGVSSVLLGRYRAMVASRYDEESRRFATLQSVPSVIRSQRHPTDRTEARSHAFRGHRAKLGAGLVLMRDMLAARGTPYVHVLQPNQYRTSRAFSPEEARIALSAASPSSLESSRAILRWLPRPLAGDDSATGVSGCDAHLRHRDRAGVYRQLLPLHAPRLSASRRRDCERGDVRSMRRGRTRVDGDVVPVTSIRAPSLHENVSDAGARAARTRKG